VRGDHGRSVLGDHGRRVLDADGLKNFAILRMPGDVSPAAIVWSS
jgi:hypothetical protein